MSRPEWTIRSARKTDQRALEAFECADSTIDWQVEVQSFVRRELCAWAFDPMAAQQDPRLLLLLERRTGYLVGVAAHERVTLKAGRRRIAATKLELVALATSWHGKRFPGGQRASDVLMSAVMTDISQRVPPRDARVFAVVHEDNLRSIALLRRHGLTDELSRATELSSYRRLVTGHRD